MQSCKSGRKLTKCRALRRAFCLGCTKIDQNNLAITLMFFRPNLSSFFFGHELGFKLVFLFRAYIFGFGPELVNPFTTPVGVQFRCFKV